MRNLCRLLWQVPMLIGAGALFAGNAKATIAAGSNDELSSTDAARLRCGEVLLKLQDDNIYFSQDAGLTFQELELTATPEAGRLKLLLEQRRNSGQGLAVKSKPMVVADGAGGVQWVRTRQSATTERDQNAERPATPASVGGVPRDAAMRGAPQTKAQ